MHKATGPRIVRNPGSIVPYTIGFSRLKSEQEEIEEEEENIQLLSYIKDKSKNSNSENHENNPKSVVDKTVLTDLKPKISSKVRK